MRLRPLLLGSTLAALALAMPAHAQGVDAAACSTVITTLMPEPIWDGTPPGMDDWGGLLGMPVEESATPDGNNLFNVTDPTIEAFLPDPACATGAAVLVVPGGGFRLVAINHEGRAVARWLAERGVAAFVLKYRVVQYAEPSLAQPVRRQLPLEVMASAGTDDGRQALDLIRTRAEEFGIDPLRTGVIGFSAGGHVAVSLALDEAGENRPAFVGNIYGALFRETIPALPPANLPYPPGTPDEIWLRPPPTPAPGALPPFFMALARDDTAVSLGFEMLADALDEAGYRPETHLYARGGHGFGMMQRGLSTDLFIVEFISWMRAIGMLEEAPDTAGND